MLSKSLLIMATAGLGLAFLATPAQAAEPDRHCVVNVSDTDAPAKCYGSFRKAIASATGGRVTDAPDARTAKHDARFAAQLNALRPEPANGSAAQPAQIVISIEWEDSDFADSSVAFTAPYGCTDTLDDVDWQAASLSPGLDDTISSYRAFSGCLVKHFEHANFGGESIGFDSGAAGMGWMDNKTSSIQWS
jgi:hypothetical protein